MEVHRSLFFLVLAGAVTCSYGLTLPVTLAYDKADHERGLAYQESLTTSLLEAQQQLAVLREQLVVVQSANSTPHTLTNQPSTEVPFYSQFTDITSPTWQKVGCGIASLAMIIDYYTEPVSVDGLLNDGITTGAYIESAGWSHAGLIGLAKQYGLDGSTVGLYEYSMDSAFLKLSEAVAEGPVMVSVHYTFQPTNPIPHLAVITDIKDGYVYYNDPAESTGGGSITAEQFKSAWKKRYIEIRPTT